MAVKQKSVRVYVSGPRGEFHGLGSQDMDAVTFTTLLDRPIPWILLGGKIIGVSGRDEIPNDFFFTVLKIENCTIRDRIFIICWTLLDFQE
jgi:hypothetical protein